MSARTMPIYMTAAWREAVRAREPYIDLDHLLLGVIAAGGPAAQALARHGLNLASARTAAHAVHAEAVALLGIDVHALAPSTPRSINELNENVSRMPMAERADQLVDSLGVHASEHDLLQALLVERSGAIRDLVERSGANLRAVVSEVGEGVDWVTPTPQRARSIEKQAEALTVAVQLTHFIPAEPQLIRSVVADPILAPHCLMFPDTMRPEADGILTVTVSRRRRTSTLSLVLSVDEEERVRWDERWDGRPSGWYEMRFAATNGGTLLTLTRSVRPLGLLGAALTPLIRLTSGLGLFVRPWTLRPGAEPLASMRRGLDQGQP